MRRDLGDFQTPPALVDAVLGALGPIAGRWMRVLEPTCGRGHFLGGLLRLDTPPPELLGIEIQPEHVEAARTLEIERHPGRVEIVSANLFDLDLRRDLRWGEAGPLLVLGNPPWVTNAELGVLGSTNAPRKRNVKRLRGIEARTGASNFDIAEAIWLKLLDELADELPTIALLCKTSVARSVLLYARREALPVTDASIHKIDAPTWFRASVDACLFRLTLGPGVRTERIPIFASLGATAPSWTWGFVGDRLVADLSAYQAHAYADGTCPIDWRQGLKHDAARVMELKRDEADRLFTNKRGEIVDVEEDYVYPLLKGGDLAGAAGATRRAVIVTQRKIGENTRVLERDAPRLWRYLQSHDAVFANRKSSIYRMQPPYGLFGIGPYSFAPSKVAVCGLSKDPRFRAIGPVDGRPVMFDDTCYFLPCPSAECAALITALLNEPSTLGLIAALSFRDAKRPITKAVLQRINLGAILERIDPAALRHRAAAVLEGELATAPVAERLATGIQELAAVCRVAGRAETVVF